MTKRNFPWPAVCILFVAHAELGTSAFAQSANWVGVGDSYDAGGVSKTGNTQDFPKVGVDAAGNPIVAWSNPDALGTRQVRLRRWTGTAWIELAGSAGDGGVTAPFGSQEFSMAVGAAGNPAVAWVQSGYIYVKAWDGNAWIGLGSSATAGVGVAGTGQSDQPAVALDSFDRPVVAWRENDPTLGLEIHLRRWNGSSWVEVGSSATAGGISSSPASDSVTPCVAVDAVGNPTVAWDEQSIAVDYSVYLRQWNGSAWVELDGSASNHGLSNTSGHSRSPSLALTPAGLPLVAWEENFNSVLFKGWTGTAWAEFGGSATGSGVASGKEPSLTVDYAGNPAIAWRRPNSTYLRYWDGASWVELNGSATGVGIASGQVAEHPCIGGHGRFVVWQEYSPVSVISPPPTEVFLACAAVSASNLNQHRLNGGDSLTVGGSTTESGVAFSHVLEGLPGEQLIFQVEVQPVGTPFAGVATASAVSGSTGDTVSVEAALAPASYHWQGRTVRLDGQAGFAWRSFGGNGEGSADLVVVAEPPPEAEKKKCGLIGIEGGLVLAALAAWRRGVRRRRSR